MSEKKEPYLFHGRLHQSESLQHTEKSVVPVGYALSLLEQYPFLEKEFSEGDYCGFQIYNASKYIFPPAFDRPGFRIHNLGRCEWDKYTYHAMRRSVCDTIEDTKYFIDQIYHNDPLFNWWLEYEIQKRERADKKALLSMMVKNI